MSEKLPIHIGDHVTWESQAGGFAKTKRGEVVDVVAPWSRPSRVKFPDLYKGNGCGYGRDHNSYVVRVDGKKHYWPRVSALRKEHEEQRTKASGGGDLNPQASLSLRPA